MRQAGFHRNVFDIFTRVWQREVRAEQSRETFEQLYRKRFGDEAYEWVRGARRWLGKQSERQALIRYLSEDDPYSA